VKIADQVPVPTNAPFAVIKVPVKLENGNALGTTPSTHYAILTEEIRQPAGRLILAKQEFLRQKLHIATPSFNKMTTEQNIILADAPLDGIQATYITTTPTPTISPAVASTSVSSSPINIWVGAAYVVVGILIIVGWLLIRRRPTRPM